MRMISGPLAAGLVTLALAMPAAAQDDEAQTCLPQGPFPGPPEWKSVEQREDGRVTFRYCAPEAGSVAVISDDLPPAVPFGAGLPMTKDASGLWSATTELVVAPDTYRYNFRVDGTRTPDPQADRFVAERMGVDTIMEVTGPDGAFQTWQKDVPHGLVSEIDYWSDTLGMMRRAFVYTPPGYMKGDESYPVLYLVHGATGSEENWSRVGRANDIADNLLAAGEAQRMIIVMPDGHTPPRDGAPLLTNTDFGGDLIDDLVPTIDATFRTIADRDHRAMAGLSMGGAHTLQFGLTRPDLFGSIGIFSMGLGLQEADQVSVYEEANARALATRAASDDLVYYAMGTEDFLYGTVAPTRAMFDKAGIDHVYNETGGGHDWINWRRYLADFLPRLFQP